MRNFNLPDKYKAVSYTVLSAIFMTLGFVTTKIFLRFTNPENLSFFWWFTAAIAVLVISLIRKENLKLLFSNYWRISIAIGFLGSVGSILWFNAVNQIGPSLTAFLSRFSVVFTVVLGMIFLKERFDSLEAIGMLVAITGAFVINFSGGMKIQLGALLIILASFIFAANGIVTKLYVQKINVFQMMILRSIFIVPVLFIYTHGLGYFEMPSFSLFFAIGFSSILSTVIGFFFFVTALRLIDISKITVIRSVDPFLVVIYSLLFFREIPDIITITGGAMIIAGIVIMVAGKALKKRIITIIPA